MTILQSIHYQNILKAPLYRDEELLDRLETYFKMRGRVLDDLNHTQADFPEGCIESI